MSEIPANTLQHRFDGPEDAPVLVLGPALGTTWHMWDRQIPELIRTWRVLRFDLPGHGGAPAFPAVTVGDLADRLLATLDALGVDEFGYAGCCIGGALGVDLALRHPHRLSSLAFVGAAARFGTAESWGVRASEARSHGLGPAARTAPEHWFTPGFAAAQPAIVDWAVQMVRTTDVPCYSAACEALAAFDARPGLGRVDVPTLVLVGAEDQVTTPADARVLVAGIHDARLAVVPGTRHLAPVEQPAAVTDLLVRHFTTTWRQPGAARRTTAPGPLPQASPFPSPEGASVPWPPGGADPAAAVPAPQGVFGPPPVADDGPQAAVAGPFPGTEDPYAGVPGAGPGDTPAAGVPYAGGAAADASMAVVPGAAAETVRTDTPAAGVPSVGAPDPGRPAGSAPAPGGVPRGPRRGADDDWPEPEPARTDRAVPGTPAPAPLQDVATAILPRTPSAGPPPAGVPDRNGAGAAMPPGVQGPGVMPVAQAPAVDIASGNSRPAATAEPYHGDAVPPADVPPSGGADGSAANSPSGSGTSRPAASGESHGDEPTTDLFPAGGTARRSTPAGDAPFMDQPSASGTPYREVPAAPYGGDAHAVPVHDVTDPHAQAASLRRRVLGDSHVDRAEAEAAADPFSRDFEEFANRATWGDTWSRPGLDLRTRSLLTLTALTVGGHLDELAAHARAALRLGVSPEEIKETLRHAALYAGLPAARAAFAAVRPEVTAHVTAEDGAPERRP